MPVDVLCKLKQFFLMFWHVKFLTVVRLKVVPFHHGMLQVSISDMEDSANILDKQLQIAGKEWLSSLWYW